MKYPNANPVTPRVRELVARTGLLDDVESDCTRYGQQVSYLTAGFADHVAGFPPRYRDADLTALSPAQCPDAIRQWLDDPAALTLWFDGGVGVGKSFAAAATAHESAILRAKAGARTPGVRWWSVAGLLDALRRDPEDDVWSQAKNAAVLVLDDFAHVRPTEWALERMWMLVEHRVSSGRRQVCTTNLPAPELRQVWGAGVMDRLTDAAYAITVPGSSRRAPIAAFKGTP